MGVVGRISARTRWGCSCMGLHAVESPRSWSRRKIGLETQLLQCTLRVCCSNSKARSDRYEFLHEAAKSAVLCCINTAEDVRGRETQVNVFILVWDAWERTHSIEVQLAAAVWFECW